MARESFGYVFNESKDRLRTDAVGDEGDGTKVKKDDKSILESANENKKAHADAATANKGQQLTSTTGRQVFAYPTDEGMFGYGGLGGPPVPRRTPASGILDAPGVLNGPNSARNRSIQAQHMNRTRAGQAQIAQRKAAATQYAQAQVKKPKK